MNVGDVEAANLRNVLSSRVDPQFPARWSPRAMSGQPVDDEALAALIEAARWAPSCFNAQPWRFLYAHRDSSEWSLFFDTLAEANQSWVKRAGLLVAVLSRTCFEHNGKPADTHSFDAGAAWMSLALQASKLGLVTHAMRGFDKQQARENLRVPGVYAIDAMIAIGHPGNSDELTDDQREREQPSDRKAPDEIACRGVFPAGEDSNG